MSHAMAEEFVGRFWCFVPGRAPKHCWQPFLDVHLVSCFENKSAGEWRLLPLQVTARVDSTGSVRWSACTARECDITTPFENTCGCFCADNHHTAAHLADWWRRTAPAIEPRDAVLARLNHHVLPAYLNLPVCSIDLGTIVSITSAFLDHAIAHDSRANCG